MIVTHCHYSVQFEFIDKCHDNKNAMSCLAHRLPPDRRGRPARQATIGLAPIERTQQGLSLGSLDANNAAVPETSIPAILSTRAWHFNSSLSHAPAHELDSCMMRARSLCLVLVLAGVVFVGLHQIADTDSLLPLLQAFGPTDPYLEVDYGHSTTRTSFRNSSDERLSSKMSAKILLQEGHELDSSQRHFLSLNSQRRHLRRTMLMGPSGAAGKMHTRRLSIFEIDAVSGLLGGRTLCLTAKWEGCFFLVLFSLLVFSTLLFYPHLSLVSSITIPLGDTEIPLLGDQFQGWMFRCEIVTCWGRFLLMGRFLFMALCLTLLLLAQLLN